MPVYRGRSLQPIHGCCEMRLPHRFWPALPKPLGRSVVSPLTVSLNYQTRVPNLVYKNGYFNNHSFDFWNNLKNHISLEYQFALAPLLYIFSLLHPCFFPSPLSCIPRSLSFSLPLPSTLSSLLGCSWTDLFGPV